MIDAQSGALTFRAPAIGLQPTWTFSELRRLPNVEVSDFGNGWRTIKLPGLYESDLRFSVTLRFFGEPLQAIVLAAWIPKDAAGWGGWSEENERERRKLHDRWLEEKVGRERIFDWGRVFSEHDERSGSASIEVRYSR